MSVFQQKKYTEPIVQNKSPLKKENKNQDKKNKKKRKHLLDITKQNILKNKGMTSSEMYLKSVLTNKLLFSEPHLDQSIFKSDLVIQLRVPYQSYIKRQQKMQLGQFMRKFPQSLHKAFQSSYRDLIQDMERKGDAVSRQKHNDKQLVIRNLASFNKITKKQIFRKMNQNQEFNTQINEINDIEAYSKLRKVYTQNGYQQYITLNCSQEYTGLLDAFIINYNSLIYALQQVCGFKVKSFMITKQIDSQKLKDIQRIKQIQSNSLKELLTAKNNRYRRKILILLYLPDDLLIKAANKFQIKKQIDYTQIDPFLNQPMDSSKRPLKFNSQIIKIMEQKYKASKLQIQSLSSQNKQQKKKNIQSAFIDLGLNVSQKKNSFEQDQKIKLQIFSDINYYVKKKTVDRKVGFNLFDYDKSYQIINQKPLSQKQIDRYMQYQLCLNRQLKYLIGNRPGHNCFNDPQDVDALTEEQKDYLVSINRYKYNRGVEKRYVQVKKQRKYFNIAKQLSKSFGYQTFQTPIMHTQFSLANKRKKYFCRLQHMLLFKQMVVSPYGELSLFLKMQRIKLSYSVLRQVVRIQNLHHFNAKIFALNDNYQKFGQILPKNSSKFSYFYQESDIKVKQGIYGGINGHNLFNDWYVIRIWKTNYNTLKNYLGQSKTFQFLLKTNLVLLFAFLAPFGIVFQIVKKVWISPQAAVVAYTPQFYFYLGYMFLAVVVYSIFIQKFRRLQQNYIQDFVQEDPFIQFRNEYRGPYMRDTTNDNANTYVQNQYGRNVIHLKDRVKTYFTFFIFLLILGCQIGYYYGIRSVIVELSYKYPQSVKSLFYIFRPIHLLGYGIFFLTNELILSIAIGRLAKYLTGLQNRPTQQQFLQSESLKLYIFQIGIELIGPIDLVFIQYADKTSCSSSWCAKELQNYVYSRYVIFFLIVLLYFIIMIRIYIKAKTIQMILEEQNQQNIKYARRLSKFLQFVYDQSKKQPCSDIKLVDETVSLIHFATFLTVFPLGALFSFFSMLIDYNTERLQILHYFQRPIPKSQGFNSYRKVVVAIGHWMLFFNFSQMFITLQWLQYLFPSVVYAILNTPTPYTFMTLKYGTILLFMLIYQLIILIVVKIAQRCHPAVDRRKWNMLQKYKIKILNSGNNVVLKQPKPIHSISRTYKIKSQVIDQQGSQQGLQRQDDSEEHQTSHEPNTYTQFSTIKDRNNKSNNRNI